MSVVTCEMVCQWLLAYLNREIGQDDLVNWARQVKLGGRINPIDAPVVNPVLARIGVTGERGYALAWEDCFDLIEDLGYVAHVVAEPALDEEDF